MNYLVCEKTTLLRSYYVYVDNRQYLADNIFEKNNIKVKYRKELDYPESDYKIIFVSVSNRKDFLFVKSMCELEEAMINKGYNDYEETCNKIFYNLETPKKKVKRCIV